VGYKFFRFIFLDKAPMLCKDEDPLVEAPAGLGKLLAATI